MAELPKVMPHIEVPIQAGDDDVLANMKRGYTPGDYRRLVGEDPRAHPGLLDRHGYHRRLSRRDRRAVHADLAGPLAELKLDVAHLARYSARDGTVATRRMLDDVPEDEKMRRFRLLETCRSRSWPRSTRATSAETVEVLFEEKVKGRWKGRTPTNKLVFVESDDDLRGQVLPVTVTWTGPWSMQGALQPQVALTTV